MGNHFSDSTGIPGGIRLGTGIPVFPGSEFYIQSLNIWEGVKNFATMSDQNSTAEYEVKPEIRPDALMDEMGVKKQTYYTYLNHLGIKAQKDSSGKAYLTNEQANLVRTLREHVCSGGKIEDFPVEHFLSIRGENDLVAEVPEMSNEDPTADFDMDVLMREAANIAGQRMTLANQIVLQLANQMTYEDLPEDVRQKVDSVRSAATTTIQPGKIAADLLSQWRQQREVTAA